MSWKTVLLSVTLTILLGVPALSLAQAPATQPAMGAAATQPTTTSAPGRQGRGGGRGRSAQPSEPQAHSAFKVDLPPQTVPIDMLMPDSPFGINTNLRPGTADLEQRLTAFQSAGIKWGRQGFGWGSIERQPGQYDFAAYDEFVDTCLKHGLRLFGQLSGPPSFHDPRTPEGVAAFGAFAGAVAKHFAGKVDHWQIWNEPNGAYWNGTPEQYAAVLAASGKAIHEANPNAKVLGLNTAFIDPVWTERILSQVPYDCFDIACCHPYRSMSAPEDKLDWWQKDQYVGNFYKGKLDETWPMIHETLLEQVGELDKVMAKHGKPKPIWFTEICWNTNIHPYGTPEIRQADMIVRFYTLVIASQRVEKAFWWTFKDGGEMQYDMGQMVGLVRPNYEPKYSYYSFAFMTRMLEGKKWIRNVVQGPDVYVIAFHDEAKKQDILVAWANKPYAYVRISNDERGVDFYDVFGTKRHVGWEADGHIGELPVPLGESPIYIVGPEGLNAKLRPDPGW